MDRKVKTRGWYKRWLIVEVVSGQLQFTLEKEWQRDRGGRGLMNALTWSNGFCGERGKRGGLIGISKAHGKEMLS